VQVIITASSYWITIYKIILQRSENQCALKCEMKLGKQV